MGILNIFKDSGKKQKPKKNFASKGAQQKKNPSFSAFPDFNTPPEAPMNDSRNLSSNDLDLPPLPSFDDKLYPDLDTSYSERVEQQTPVSSLPEPKPPQLRETYDELVQPKPVEPVEPIYHSSRRGNYVKHPSHDESPKEITSEDSPRPIPPLHEETYQEQTEPEKKEPAPSKVPGLSDVPDFEYSGYLNKPTSYEKRIKKPILRDIPQEPLFIQMKEFHDILHHINTMQYRLKELNNIDNLFSDIQIPSDTQYNHWHETIEDIQRKLLYVDRMIFEQNEE